MNLLNSKLPVTEFFFICVTHGHFLSFIRYIAVTQFEATDARAAFPCFDEPDMKAGFTLTMIREPRHVALFNMPKVNTEELEGGLLQDRFETSVIMSTYLVAFIICDFPKITNYTSRHIAVRTMGNVTLVAITGTTILVSYLWAK